MTYIMDELKEYEKALEIAKKAHSGQVDKAGIDYILHPMYLAKQMPTVDLKIIAILHDVLEDSDYTREDLIREGIREEIVEVIEILSRKETETYMEYIERVSKHQSAKIIKKVDLKHNMDISRFKNPELINESLLKRYKKALKYLEE